MLTIMVLGMGSSIVIFQQARLQYSETPEAHMLFNMAQYEFELQRTTSALIDVIYSPENGTDQREFEKWFNILWSRTSVLDQGEIGAQMRKDGFDLVAVKLDMEKIDKILTGKEAGDRRQLQKIRLWLQDMSETSHRFIVKREFINRHYNIEQRKAFFSSFRNSIILGVTSFVLGLLVVSHLYRNNMKLLNLRENLEDRVNKRTGELQLSNTNLKKEITERYRVEKELKKSQAAAEKANMAKSEFLAIMSHEIRTPLAGIIGMSELLLKSDLGLKQLDWSRSVKISGENLLSILNDILDQSKLEFGKLDFVPTDIHLSSFIEGTAQLFSATFNEKELSRVIDFDENLPEFIKVDSLRFGQILSNLLSNALKFTNRGGITISVGHTIIDGEQVLVKVSIKDTGIGFNKEAQGRLFTAFHQGDSSISRLYGGTGLGLSISKQLVEAMGGAIGVESEEGHGSVFWFTIPCLAVGGKDLQDEENVESATWIALRSLKILVAEDNFINQRVIFEIFNSLGHDVTVAENGRIAVDRVLEDDFDIVLMDIRMPEMDGVEATKLIRSMKNEKSDLPIIAVTADIAAEGGAVYIEAGMNDVCTKPLDLPKLFTAINRAMNESIHIFETEPRPDGAPQEIETESITDHLGDQANDFVTTMETATDLLRGRNSEEKTKSFFIEGVNAEATIALRNQYEELLVEQCEKLGSTFSELADHPDDRLLRQEVLALIHSLKGDGGTYGYPLVSMLAGRVNEIMSGSEVLDLKLKGLLSNHIQALVLIGSRNVSGDGGEVGRILLEALNNTSS